MPGDELLSQMGGIAVARSHRVETVIQDIVLGTEQGCKLLEDCIPLLAETFVVPASAVASRFSSLQFPDGRHLLAAGIREAVFDRFGPVERKL